MHDQFKTHAWGAEFRVLGAVASIRLKGKKPWCTSRGGVGCRIQDLGIRGYRWWKTPDFLYSARTAHGAPPITCRSSGRVMMTCTLSSPGPDCPTMEGENGSGNAASFTCLQSLSLPLHRAQKKKAKQDNRHTTRACTHTTVKSPDLRCKT